MDNKNNRILLLADSTIKVDIKRLASQLNVLCEYIEFEVGLQFDQLDDPVIVFPDTHINQIKARAYPLVDYRGIFLLTSKPYADRFFFHAQDNFVIVSFCNWESFTDLPIANGVVYFVANAAALSFERLYRHQEQTGCVYDLCIDKRGIQTELRSASLCRTCAARLQHRPHDEESTRIVADMERMLNLCSDTSRRNRDVLDYEPNVNINSSILARRFTHAYRIRYGQPFRFEEGLRYEYKEVTTENVIDAIVRETKDNAIAFLNSRQGGSIFFGIRDGDQVVVGVRLSASERDRLRQRMVNAMKFIRPRVSQDEYRIHLHELTEGDHLLADQFVVELEILPGNSVEIYRKGDGKRKGEGKIYLKTEAGLQELDPWEHPEWVESEQNKRRNRQE